MKERPIIFSAPMIRAILEGRKTQTRRIVKPQPEKHERILWREDDEYPSWVVAAALSVGENYIASSGRFIHCPFGNAGDRLWVREAFLAESRDTVHYRADGWGYSDCPKSGWKPSIYMPRAASRITLEVTSVRVERLQDISEEDAKAEGAHIPEATPGDYYQHHFCQLWRTIHGPFSWQENPWLWVLQFQRIEANGKNP